MHALIYHDIAAPAELEAWGFPGPVAARYKLDPARFEAHLDAIVATGARVGLPGEGADAMLTFDDGGASAMRAAAALERRGWRGCFFITTGRIGTSGFLTAPQIVELAGRGHEIGSHSHTHPPYMGALPAGRLADEWRRSRHILGELLGREPRSAAVPGGFLSHALIEQAAAAAYGLLMTSQPTARPGRCGDMLVQGRYTIWAGTTPGRAAAYARGDRLACASMWLAWQAKTVAKRISRPAYEGLRRRWAASRRPGTIRTPPPGRPRARASAASRDRAPR